MAKVKKDMLSEKFYKSMKKHPLLKNPIFLVYLIAFFALVVGYVIYLIYTEGT